MAEVDRPPLGVTLTVDNLSGTYKTLIEYNNALNRFKIGEDVDNTDYQDPNILNKRTMTTGFKKVEGKAHGFRPRENFLDAYAIGEAEIPVGSAKNANQFDKDEQFFLLYCPNPFDRGSIAYRSLMKLYYDGSPFATIHTGNSQGYAFCYLKNRNNSFRKPKDATGNKKMKAIYKQAYEAPKMESFKLKQSVDVLSTFSVGGDIEDPSYGDSSDWGNLENQIWHDNESAGF